MSDNLPAVTRIAPPAAAPSAHLTPVAAEPPCEPRWTAERQAAFLRELAATHNVALAARSVGMSRQSAYRLRARLKGQPFDRAWAMAFGTAFDALAQAALERALDGVEVPHIHKGEIVATSRRYDERLTIALLSMRGALAAVPAVPTSAVAPQGLEGQIARVEDGPELWDDDIRHGGRRR